LFFFTFSGKLRSFSGLFESGDLAFDNLPVQQSDPLDVCCVGETVDMCMDEFFFDLFFVQK